MKADWRTSLMREAIQAFSNDLNYAVAVVTPRKPAAQPRRIVWGAPPRIVPGLRSLGRTESSATQ